MNTSDRIIEYIKQYKQARPNDLAKKCKEQGLVDEVMGLTLTGSINGFDVLREI